MTDITKQANKILGAGVNKRIFNDRDGDKVPDIFDCKPNDPNKQGWVHDIKERMEERKEANKYKREADRVIRESSREAYYKAKEEQSLRVARERAKLEADRKIKSHRSGGVLGAVTRYADKARRKPPARRRTTARRKPAKKRTTRRTYTKTYDKPPSQQFGDLFKL